MFVNHKDYSNKVRKELFSMLDMQSFARDIADRLHHSASYFPEEFAGRLAADLRSIVNIDWSKSKDLFIARKRELVLSYGYQPTQQTDEKPFAFAEGLAFIPVHGMLLNRFSGSYSFATGYNFLRSQRMAAEADPDVKGIVYDYNTYGGTAAGCGELSKEMFDSRDKKPTLGVIDHSCYSAGYFIGSSNHRLVASPSSGTGSIGCVSMHIDLSEMLKQDGIKITFIKSGKEKTDGNPYEPLSKTAETTIQRSVDYHASAFFEAVSRNRGIDESEIRALQARCFDPPGALENGLIDVIQTPAEAVSSFLNSLNGGVPAMTTQPNAGGTAPATMTKEEIAAAITAGITSALPTALAAHDKAKTERRAAILGCDEAKKRQKFAVHLADNTSMSVDEAKALLANAAEEQPAKGNGNRFHEAMSGTPNPNVGADSETNGGGEGGEGGGESDTDAAARLLGTYVAATGNKVVPIKKAS
jgi:signal peptide peptidase SppA